MVKTINIMYYWTSRTYEVMLPTDNKETCKAAAHHVDSTKKGHEFTEERSTQTGHVDERTLGGEIVRKELARTTERIRINSLCYWSI